LGKALMQPNTLKEAIAAFREALITSPDFAEARQNLQQPEELLSP